MHFGVRNVVVASRGLGEVDEAREVGDHREGANPSEEASTCSTGVKEVCERIIQSIESLLLE